LELVFSQAKGRNGGDRRGTSFDIFKGQLGACLRFGTDKEVKHLLEPSMAGQNPLW
jgi:hypothetical protein